jgi:CUG-BP- and ETR3-like factor
MADQAELSAAVGVEGVPAAAAQWTEHSAPNGRKYYYNSTTGESTWERCAIVGTWCRGKIAHVYACH